MTNLKSKSIIAVFSFMILIFLCNRDLFDYNLDYPYGRTFSPAHDAKGSYLLTPVFLLRGGNYSIDLHGSAEKASSGMYVVNSSEEIIYSSDIPGGEIQQFPLQLSGPENVRIGINYDPESANVEIDRIRIKGKNVLYPQNLLRHLVISVLLIICYAYFFIRINRPAFFTVSGVKLSVYEPVMILFLGISFVMSGIVSLTGKYILTDDLYFHLSRIYGLSESLHAGYFPAPIYLGWLQDYGVGAGFYYPDLFLYIPAVLHLCGFSLLTSLDVFHFLCCLSMLAAMFFSSYKIAKNDLRAGVCSAVLYGFSSYFSICLFYRGALGEVQAFIFFPVIILGLYEIFTGCPEKWWLFAIGFWGILSCHMISLSIAIVISFVFIIINIRKLFHCPAIFMALIKAVSFVVLLGSSFIFPMAEQILNNDLPISSIVSDHAFSNEVPSVCLLEFRNLFQIFDDWKSHGGAHEPFPGLIFLLILGARIVFRRYLRKDKAVDVIALFGVILILCTTNLFPWNFFSWFLDRIQVSWRLLAPATALLALASGIYVSDLICHKKAWIFILCIFLLINAVPILGYCLIYNSHPRTDFILDNQNVSAKEYMPDQLTAEFVDKNKLTVFMNGDVYTSVIRPKKRGLSFDFSFGNLNDSETMFTVPLIYHYGYKAEVKSGDSLIRPDVTKDDYGLVSFRLSDVTDGSAHLMYTTTVCQWISRTISTCTFAFILLWFVRKSVLFKR